MNDELDSLSPENENIDDQSRMTRKKEYKKREAKNWILSLIAAVVIALTLRFFVFEFIRVDGPSMQPILYTDEYVFMEKVTFWFRTPERGDIIICSFPDSPDSFIKRVIGVPGDRLRITDGVLYINDEANYDFFDDIIRNDMDQITVPEDCVFAMGDNRNQSRDSRDPSVGAIPNDKVMGKALFVIWPLDKMHGL